MRRSDGQARMMGYGDRGEVREVLSRLEVSLETYLGAWRREFGMDRGPGAVSSNRTPPRTATGRGAMRDRRRDG